MYKFDENYGICKVDRQGAREVVMSAFTTPEIERMCKRLDDLETQLLNTQKALAWLEEMASYASQHLEPQWAAKNKSDLLDAIYKANHVLP